MASRKRSHPSKSPQPQMSHRYCEGSPCPAKAELLQLVESPNKVRSSCLPLQVAARPFVNFEATLNKYPTVCSRVPATRGSYQPAFNPPFCRQRLQSLQRSGGVLGEPQAN